MPSPRRAAERLLSVLSCLRDFPSGSYVDLRRILDPAEYARLMASAPGAGPAGG